MAGETILIVEDEPLVGVELQEQLIDLGYQVPEVLTEGTEVPTAALRVKPDLILMDIRIRGPVDGIQAAGELRSRSDVPIIFLTAYSDPDTVARVAGVSPDGYLLKPFRERELEANIAMVLQKKALARDQRSPGLGSLVSIVDTLDAALVLFDPAGTWLHGNPGARQALGPGRQGQSLPDLLGADPAEWAADPGAWTGREIPLEEGSWGGTLTVEPWGTEGFIGTLNTMEKQERDHLGSSIRTIQASLADQFPRDDAFPDRLSNGGFLLSRPSGSGDFCDLFPLGPHHFLFYSLDVAGHGLLSSMAVLSLRSMIRELAGNFLVRSGAVPSPSDLLATLNQRYLASTPGGPFFTIVLGVLTPSSGELTVARAGHPVPLVVGHNRKCRKIGGGGPALGVFSPVSLEDVSERLRPGEKLVLTSDGVLERLGGQRLELGASILVELLRNPGPAGTLARVVKDACLAIGEPMADDLSLLVLEPRLW